MRVRPAFSAFFSSLVLLVAGSVWAQQPAPPLTATWQDGFVFQSGDGSFRLELDAVAQADGRFSLDDPTAITNTFTLRKARPIVSGRLGRYFDFRLMPEFAGGTPVMLDAYLDMRFANAFRLRAGKDKTPVGYELLIGDANLFFPERALPSSLAPNRDVGFQAQGDLAGQKLSYSGGVFNGVPDGVTSTTDVDANGAKDFAGRVIVQPFRPGAGAPATVLSGLGFHLGGSAGKQYGALPSYRTSIGQTYFTYAAGASASGTRTRVTPAVFYFYQSFGAFGEYVRSTQDVAGAATTHDVTNDGWNITGALLLTGETATSGTVRPLQPFDPAAGHWGALQLLARYSTLDVDAAVFGNGLAAAGASGSADAFTLALNWYPTSFIKWYAAYERVVFDCNAGGARPAEHSIHFRAQVAF